MKTYEFLNCNQSTWSKPLAKCCGGVNTIISSVASGGNGPGELFVNIYVFAGVTANVNANNANAETFPREEFGSTTSESVPKPPTISHAPVQLTWNRFEPGSFQRPPNAFSCGTMASKPSGNAKCAAPASTYVRPSKGHVRLEN
ncbi:unnamed protein product [Bathycoccus prasinos]